MAELKITSENFESEVLNSTVPVIVDFWAPWCGPCRMLGPVIEQIANERSDIKVGKVNVDEEDDLAAKFGITSIPTIILFKEGKAEKQLMGVRPKAQILAMLD
ncbi:MAG: thioredoxin [Clostridia bacterium]|nr:thioredoxin [Clostridia bacterium]